MPSAPRFSSNQKYRQCLYIAALLLAPCSLVFADSRDNLTDAELKEARDLDWVPLEELTEEQKKTVPSACCGAYIAPLRVDVDAAVSPNEAPLRATAAETQSEQQKHVSMTGKVAITQGNRSITTDTAHVDQDTRQAALIGNIQMREPGLLFRADKAQVNMDSGDAQLDNTTFVLYETRVHGKAKHLQKFGDNIINLEQSEISSCEPGDNSWSIEGSAITLHTEEHYGTAKNMRVNIKDVPVMYMPYARFPLGNERLSGFLFPSLSSSSHNGVDIATPFYWNLAPNYDATITPRFISDRGAVFEAETRHMAQAFDTELSGSFISNDRGGYNETEYSGDDRWLYSARQKGGHGHAWSSLLTYTDMSDNDFQRDMNNSSVDANRQAYVHQLASIDYHTEHWLMGAKADEYRLLTANQLPYRELPRVYLNGEYRSGDWLFNLKNEYVDFAKNRYFTRETASTHINYDDVIYGKRLSNHYSVVWDQSAAWGFVKPGLALKSLHYQLDKESLASATDDSPAFAVPQASLDTGLYFERATSVFGGDYLQTFEPRAFYFYSAYKNQDTLYNLTDRTLSADPTNPNNYINFDTSELTFNYNQLFRQSRFAGGDRIDDANQVSLAISSAFVSESTGIERLRVSLGQIFYAKDRRVTVYDNRLLTGSDDTERYLIEENTRSSSAVAMQLSGQIGSSLRLSADAAYDQKAGQMDYMSAGVHYMDDEYRIFNIAYRYTLRPIISSPSQLLPLAQTSLDQIDTSLLWPINSRWSLIARTNYDFHYGVELDTFAGFEYNDCCYRARVMWRRWLNFDYSPDFLANVSRDDYEQSPYPFIEIELKGLGSMSKRISSLLDKAVAGFSEREKNLH